ncbi:toprim domain-containing protein [Rhodopirellula europaea]|uniref:Mobilizable transposon, excision protein n=1 Tax=Rhodopirellula europaea 6C TaxID=1263867 RepID=M2AQ52_9BACT|nr:toprim domain-containing protein [Rhodopirellula europaea]EMB14857.1 mobilizable transposon, excision protein [Rhodopirellula europaea 6C]
MNITQAKQVPLADVLQRLGHTPAYRRGEDLWFQSPFRQESEPSFKVNENNYWYDFATGEHGDIIDLMRAIRGGCTVKEALAELRSLLGQPAADPLPKAKADAPVKTQSTAEITSVGPIQSRALLSYLRSRGISEQVAKANLQEVRYKRDGNNYFAIAFENDAGGFEIRTEKFKGSLQSKAITTRHPGGDTVSVFEGFTDWLTAIERHAIAPDDTVIVMNSAALKAAVVEQIKALAPTSVSLWLDNDATGTQTKQDLIEMLSKDCPQVKVTDHSSLYSEFNDLNALHMEEQKRFQR